jgi:hypothetical protein
MLIYNAVLAWMLLRVVALERKTFDAAALSMFGHITATTLFSLALFRTQYLNGLPRALEKVANIPDVVENLGTKEA